MAEENGEVVGALADLIRSSNLSEEQRTLLLRLSRHKGALRHSSHAKGPYTHCKFGDRVEVKYPDGSSEVLTVKQAGPMKLRLSTLTADQLSHRTEVAAALILKNKSFTDARMKFQAGFHDPKKP